MAYTSAILYHFVGSASPNDDERNYDTLGKILTSMELRPCAVDGKIEAMITKFDRKAIGKSGELIESNRTCVCDIPLEQMHLHSQKYGRFGVGVDRSEFASWGGRPIIYIPAVPWPGGTWADWFPTRVFNAWEGLRNNFGRDSRPSVTIPEPPADNVADAAHNARSVLGTEIMPFIKRFNATLPEGHPENFYMEREWRKFGRFGLHMSLRQVVVPASHLARAKSDFPAHASKVIALPE